MSLSRIEIRNFQSLRKVDLDLGAFTVIVGPSSSGKSALIRAFKAAASNVRGPAVITRGQRQAAITVRTDSGQVTLERSEASGLYRLVDGQGAERVFTKLNGGVPEAVTTLLRIAPVPSSGASVNFAAQFDRPYLLDDTGATVARVLGELTNVDTIFEAVRTANKRRQQAAGLLKTRRADREQTQRRLAAFESLPERLNALNAAESLHEGAGRLTERIRLLASLLGQLRQAETRLADARRYAAPPPDGTALDAANTRLEYLVSLMRRTAVKQASLATAVAQAEASAAQVTALEHALDELVDAARVCPTCGQSTV